MTKATLPELLNQSITVDSKLEEFLDSLENYPEEYHSEKIALFYQQQVSCASNISDKVNSWCWAITKLESQADFYRAQARRFTKLAQVTENQSKSMREFLKLTIESNGGKLPTKDFPKLRLQKSANKLIINDLYDGIVPEGLIKKLPLSEIIDKAKVKEMIDNGNELAFASIQEGGKALYGLK